MPAAVWSARSCRYLRAPPRAPRPAGESTPLPSYRRAPRPLQYATRSCISTSIVPMAEEFGWDKKTCGTVLSSFFAGYCIT